MVNITSLCSAEFLALLALSILVNQISVLGQTAMPGIYFRPMLRLYSLFKERMNFPFSGKYALYYIEHCCSVKIFNVGKAREYLLSSDKSRLSIKPHPHFLFKSYLVKNRAYNNFKWVVQFFFNQNSCLHLFQINFGVLQ